MTGEKVKVAVINLVLSPRPCEGDLGPLFFVWFPDGVRWVLRAAATLAGGTDR